MIKYCDYCTCDDCVYGSDHTPHAATIGGKYICDTCYTYEVCQSFPGFRGNPCNIPCVHRPKLISPWMDLGKQPVKHLFADLYVVAVSSIISLARKIVKN